MYYTVCPLGHINKEIYLSSEVREIPSFLRYLFPDARHSVGSQLVHVLVHNLKCFALLNYHVLNTPFTSSGVASPMPWNFTNKSLYK